MKSRAMPSSLSRRVVSSQVRMRCPASGLRAPRWPSRRSTATTARGPDRGERAPAASASTSARKSSRTPVVEEHEPGEVGGALLAVHRGPARVDEEAEPVAQPLLLRRHVGREGRAEAGQEVVVELPEAQGHRRRVARRQRVTLVDGRACRGRRTDVDGRRRDEQPDAEATARMTTSRVRERTLSPPALREPVGRRAG